MPRFYKTSSADPLDYMHRLNLPLMEKVVAANDHYITQNLQTAGQLETLATSFPYLQADEGRANEIMKGYSTKIDEITKAIREDPANWRKQLEPIRGVSRELQQNYKTGEISKITGNYSQYKKVADNIDKQLEEYNKSGKGISADRAKAYKEYFLKQFLTKDPKGTNYNPQTGQYNAINVFDPMGNIDVRKMLSEEMDKIKADKRHYKKSEVTGEEWYFNDKTQTWEGITPEKILSIATDRLNNPQLMDYLKQDSQVGVINGVFDDNGKFIAPYEYKGVPISPDEQKQIENIKTQIAKTKNNNIKAQLQGQLAQYEEALKGRKELEWNGQSYLAPVLRGIVEQYSYGQSSEENTLRNNSKGQTKFVQAQTTARNNANIASRERLAREREKGINDRFNREMEWNKYKWDNPQEKTGTGTKKITGKDEPKPVESTVSKFNTNSFEDWTTTDSNGKQVKVLSTDGLTADISRFNEQYKKNESLINNLSTAMKDLQGNRNLKDLSPAETIQYNKLLIERDAAVQNNAKVQSELNARKKWLDGSTDAVLKNTTAARKDKDGDIAKELTAEEVKLYNEFANDRDGSKLREDISKNADYRYVFPGANKGTVSGFKQWLENNLGDPSDELYQKRLRLTKYLDVKEKVDERRENFLAQMRYTPIDTDGIKLGSEDSKAIAAMILNNPQGTQLYDNTGNKTDKIGLEGKGVSWFDPKGDNYKMTTADDKRNIFAYMMKHNVEFDVEQIGNTTKIGNGGAVAQVRFKDPNGEIPSGYFYVDLTPELQKQIGTRLSINKNTDVSKIGGAMLDNESNDIRKQLITPTIQRTAGANDSYDPVTFTIFINNGNTKIPLQVTKFPANDGTDHLNITGSVGGQQVPLKGTASGIPGWFNGADDFINYIKAQRQKQ